jgi:hypothetical protein
MIQIQIEIPSVLAIVARHFSRCRFQRSERLPVYTGDLPSAELQRFLEFVHEPFASCDS